MLGHCWLHLATIMYLTRSFCAAYCQILNLMQHFILGDMMESKGKLSLNANTVVMWMNTHKTDAKYSKGFIPIRQSLEHELQDGTSMSNNRTE